MRVEQCIDIDGNIYYLGESVRINGFTGYISEITIGFMKITNAKEDKTIRVEYNNINEIQKRGLLEGETDFRKIVNMYL